MVSITRRPLCFAPAKINLGLKITGRYKSGYHRLETIFVPITIFDRIEIAVSAVDMVFHSWPRDAEQRVLSAGTFKNPLLKNTLNFARAYLTENFSAPMPPLSVRVTKRIPSPAGLGGASADAAALFAALVHTYSPDADAAALPTAWLARLEKLGADIPFFLKHGLRGEAAYLQGVGHELTPLAIPPLGGLICVPPFGFATANMFAEVRQWDLPQLGEESASELEPSQSNLTLRLNEIPYSDEPQSGIRELQNDFDTAARAVFPDESRLLTRAKKTLAATLRQFFRYDWVIGMTGSGAALFAATGMDISMQRLSALDRMLKTRLGSGWQVLPFQSYGRQFGP